MSSGDEGLLTLTIKMRVSPEPELGEELISLMKRYREALNYAIEVVIENKALSLGRAHKLLYSVLKERYGLPSRIAQDCYREAIAVAKSWLRNPKKGKIPKVRTLKLWLTQEQSYRVKDNYVELIGGFKLEITGWDRRYDSYPNREARLVYRNGEFFLMITKQIPKPSKYTPKGVVAVDVNKKEIVFGNSVVRERRETAIERALHYKKLAEKLQQKYSFSKYNAWLRRKGILRRIGHFHRKACNIVEDWAKKTSLEIAELARQHRYAVAREDLTGLIERLRELPRDHKVALLILSYRKLSFWIDWQCEKLGVPIIPVEPKHTSSICPNCSSRLKGNGYRRLKCPRCGLEEDRDRVAVLNIEKRALEQLEPISGGPLTAPTAPQMTDVTPNRCGEPMNRPEGTLALQGGEEVRHPPLEFVVRAFQTAGRRSG
jgi:putative transposase